MTVFSISNREGDTKWDVDGYVIGSLGIYQQDFYGERQWNLTHTRQVSR